MNRPCSVLRPDTRVLNICCRYDAIIYHPENMCEEEIQLVKASCQDVWYPHRASRVQYSPAPELRPCSELVSIRPPSQLAGYPWPRYFVCHSRVRHSSFVLLASDILSDSGIVKSTGTRMSLSSRMFGEGTAPWTDWEIQNPDLISISTPNQFAILI